MECSGLEGAFSWADYTVLSAMLLGSVSVGFFYGWMSPSASGSDFLLAGGTMSTLPTALSLAAGFITAIELLGNPSEMYFHGSQFWMMCLSFMLVLPITSRLFLPVFMKLRLTSSYEYLELRFSKSVRVIAATLYLVQMTVYTSVAVYAPALALSQVTSLNTYLAVVAVYVVCVFYASQGGMKAVIIADSFQATLLVISILLVMVIGNTLVGGFETVLRDSLDSHRIQFFDFSPDPTVRHSFWSVVIGGTFYWATMFCSNQASIQKYLSVQTLAQARRALWTSCVSMIVIFSINFYTGMVMVSSYHQCDPFSAGMIGQQDEILPFYVMERLSQYVGLPGLFVSGIFAASLGTVACAVNSLSAVFMSDILDGLFSVKIAESKAATMSKWLSVMFGLLSFCLVFLVERLGSVLQVALSFNGMTGGVTLGLFSLGIMFPWGSGRGALSGALAGILVVGWTAVGALLNPPSTSTDLKPLSTDGCLCNITNPVMVEDEEEVWWWYRVSYLWYSALGCLTTMVVGAVVSLLSGPTRPASLDPDLLSPIVSATLAKLPNPIKERLDIPIDSKDVPNGIKTEDLKSVERGIDNPALTLEAC